MSEVTFTQMKDGTQEDYLMLDRLEQEHVKGLPDRILSALASLSDGLAGYKIDRLQHSLQTATRAEDEGRVSIGLLPLSFTTLVMSLHRSVIQRWQPHY